MKSLILNEYESFELKRDGAVEIVRNGFPILVENDNIHGGYRITIVNIYDKIIIK